MHESLNMFIYLLQFIIYVLISLSPSHLQVNFNSWLKMFPCIKFICNSTKNLYTR